MMCLGLRLYLSCRCDGVAVRVKIVNQGWCVTACHSAPRLHLGQTALTAVPTVCLAQPDSLPTLVPSGQYPRPVVCVCFSLLWSVFCPTVTALTVFSNGKHPCFSLVTSGPRSVSMFDLGGLHACSFLCRDYWAISMIDF